MDDLNDILIFAKVVQLESFTAAAERLNLPKSSVSRRVARLEERLGARLINRSTRRLSVTEVGWRYYEYCDRIERELAEASGVVESYQSEPSGLLRVTAPYALGQAFMSHLVSTFLDTYPNARVQVDLTNRQVDLIEERFDVAIRVGTLEDSSLVLTHLGRGASKLFAGAAYFEAFEEPLTPKALSRHVLIDRPLSGTAVTLIKEVDRKVLEQVTVDIYPRLVCNDDLVRLESAIANQGIAVLPTFVARSALDRGLLVSVLPDWAVRIVDVSALYPSYKDLSPAVRAFVALAKEQLQDCFV